MRTALILAAGQSRRMVSRRAKVVHQVGGRPMIEHVVNAARAAGIPRIVVVVGHRAEDVKAVLGDRVEYVLQQEQRGTGHAVMQAAPQLAGEEHVLVLNGDTPLLTGDALASLVEAHLAQGQAATLLTTRVPDPTGYGRIQRDEAGNIARIVEEADADDETKGIGEINTGIGCYRVEPLLAALTQVAPNNRQGEYYLVDVVPLLLAAGHKVGTCGVEDYRQFLNVNDRQALAAAEAALRQRVLARLMAAGVTVVDPANTYVDDTVTVGMDTVILPFSIVTGNTVIGADCIIGPGAVIDNSHLEDGCRVEQSTVRDSRMGAGSRVGPYSHLRPGTELAPGVKVGNFAEIKNSTVGPGSKVSHHSYIGDSRIGRDVNIGAGAVTVNYDGYRKHQTVIGDKAFVGCNVNIIAPVEIGPDSYVAAGSTINQDVPAEALAIARSRQENKPGWVPRRRQRMESEKDRG